MEIKEIIWGSNEYQKALLLRDDILRKPLGMSIYNDPLTLEKEDIHFAIIDSDKVIGTCFYRYINTQEVQMKQVAISSKYQGQNLGKQMFIVSKEFLKHKDIKRIIVHARITALGFYQKQGFTEFGESFTEVGIEHHLLAYNL